MALGEIVDLSQIPYLSKGDFAGRFICSLSFYDDGAWHTWLSTEGPGQKVIEVQAWPAEAIYFGKTPENSNDIYRVVSQFECNGPTDQSTAPAGGWTEGHRSAIAAKMPP